MYALSTIRLVYTLIFNYPFSCCAFLTSYLVYIMFYKYYDYCIYEYYLYNINSDCAICFEECKGNHDEPDCVLLQCRHVFHLKCIKQWILSGQANNNKCPVCRANLMNINNTSF